MINSVADELLRHVYRGERPVDPAEFYAGTKYIGYGNASLAEHFSPWSCGSAPPSSERDPFSWAVPLLLGAPRYTVASRLVHLLYQPRVPISSTTFSVTPYILAVHLRRGDKLNETRNSEKIQVWSVEQVVSASASAIEQHRLGKQGTVLLASDDNAFAAKVQARIEKTLGLTVIRPPNEHDRGMLSPFDACDQTCIAPLLELVAGFARSKALMLSTKSNMGSFMLSWWGAANNDMVPPLVDMDAKVHKGPLAKGRFFCFLMWGSRRGLCESNSSIPGDSKGRATFQGSMAHRYRGRADGAVSQRKVRRLQQFEELGTTGNSISVSRSCRERSSVEVALTSVLCSGGSGGAGFTSLPPVIVRDGVVGLFSQLNQLAQELLARAYRGEGPHSLFDLYQNTRLVGYGGQTLATHFDTSLICPAPSGNAQGEACGQKMTDAAATLRRAPRYEVTGALLRLAFRPRRPATLVAEATTRFDLAVHVRRGDRLLQARPVERIEAWEERALLKQMLMMLGLPSESSAAATSATRDGEGTKRGKRPIVLVASDDNAYLHQLATLARGAGLRVVLLPNTHEAFDAVNHSVESAKVCNSECVPPLLGMLAPFARAERLILSSKSNLGGYLLSWWAAANKGRTAPLAFHDLDHALRTEALPRRYFCELPWGTRRGLCSSGQSACDLKRNLESNFCPRGKG